MTNTNRQSLSKDSITISPSLFTNFMKARRALRALKGLVKLQALVRGHNVRRQAKLALKCMQSLVQVQDRVLDQQRARLSHEGYRNSMFAETNALWESRYLQDIRSRKSMVTKSSNFFLLVINFFILFIWRYTLLCLNGFMSQSRDMSCTTDEWDDRPQTSEEIEAILQNKKQAALKREKALAYAFSNQVGLVFLLLYLVFHECCCWCMFFAL